MPNDLFWDLTRDAKDVIIPINTIDFMYYCKASEKPMLIEVQSHLDNIATEAGAIRFGGFVALDCVCCCLCCNGTGG